MHLLYINYYFLDDQLNAAAAKLAIKDSTGLKKKII